MKFPTLWALPLAAFAGPALADATANALEYQSAFETYQAYDEPGIANWPALNRQVKEIGGWQVYAREPMLEQQQNEPAQQPAGQTNPAQAPAHGAHDHGGKP